MTNLTVACLQSAFEADPDAMQTLLSNYIPCTDALAEHPHVVVTECAVLPTHKPRVSFLGVLNGVLAAHGLPLVAAKWGERGDDGCSLLEGFVEYEPPTQQTEQPKPTPVQTLAAIYNDCEDYLSENSTIFANDLLAAIQSAAAQHLPDEKGP